MMRFLGTALGIVLLTASLASAQTPPPAGQGRGEGRGAQQAPPPMTNLQIIPKDTPRPQVVATMQAISQALGVRCEHCHVDEGRGGRQDFAADEKAPKATARVMMRLTADINNKLKSELTNSHGVTVSCTTCHRGVPIPRQIGDILTQTTADKGLPTAVDQYRDLRKQFYGGQSYDFSENGLIAYAQRLGNTEKLEDALQWLQLNTEYYPKSSRTYAVMSQIYGRKNDKENQIKSLEKAAELDPENQQIKAQLQRLKSGH